MNLTPEQKELGRRNFLRALAGTPALAALGAAPRSQGPGARRARAPRLHRRRRRRARAARHDRSRLRATCARSATSTRRSSTKADEVLAKAGRPKATHYADWKEMIAEGEPRGRRPRAAALGARRHRGRLPRGGQARAVREDDGLGRRRLRAHARRRAQDAARSSRSATSATTTRCTRRPTTASSRPATLGDVFHARLVWHRNGNWRRKGEPPSPDYDAVAVGLPDLRPPDQLAALQAVLARAHGRAGQPPGERSPTGSSAPSAEAVDGHRRRLPLQGRPRGPRPRLRDVRVPGRPHRGLLLDRVERLRPLLRGVLRHEGHADPARRDRGLPLRRGRRAEEPKATTDRGRVEGAPGPASAASESRSADAAGASRGTGARRGRRRRPPRGVPLRGRRVLLRRSAPARRSSAGPRRRWARPAPASPASRRSTRSSASSSRRPERRWPPSERPRRALPDEAGVRLLLAARRDPRWTLRPGRAARDRRRRAAARGRRHPGARGAPAPAVRGTDRDRPARRRDRRRASRPTRSREVFAIMEALETVAGASRRRADDRRATRPASGRSSRPWTRPLAAAELETWAELNRTLHRAIGEIAAMPMLQEMTERVLVRWERLRRYYFEGRARAPRRARPAGAPPARRRAGRRRHRGRPGHPRDPQPGRARGPTRTSSTA